VACSAAAPTASRTRRVVPSRRLQLAGQRVTADPRAARTCGGASATHSLTAVNDLALAQHCGHRSHNNDVRL
jgi:hypothetical protein